MRLLLIRHGQTPANVRGELDTAHPGPGLTALGRRQASAIPAALAHRGESVEALFVSSLIRTSETAAPLATELALAPEMLAGVHEIEAGDLELATDQSSYRSYLGTAFAWGTGNRDARMPGGSDGHAFFERFDQSIATVADSGADRAAVFSHGAAIRVWVAGVAKNMNPSRAAEEDLDNTALVVLDGSPRTGWKLVSWGGGPVGSSALTDTEAEDPTGDALDRA